MKDDHFIRVNGGFRWKTLLLIAVAGVILYSSFYIIVPLRNRVVQNEDLAAALRRELELRQRPGVKEGLNRESKDLQVRLESLDRIMPPEEKKSEMIVTLTSLARKHNLNQSHISESREGRAVTEPEIPDEQMSVATFLWKGSGYYEDVKGFLQELESGEPLLEIGSLKLEKKETRAVGAPGKVSDAVEVLPERGPELSVTLQLRAYYDPREYGFTSTPAGKEETPEKLNPFR